MAIHHRGAAIHTGELEDVRTWTEPGLNPATGKVPIGVTAACWNAYWPLWRPGAGMTNGLVYGSTGTGKTASLELLAREAEASDRLTPAVIDGAGVNLNHWAYAATGAADAIDLLRELLQEARTRAAACTAGRYTGPTPDEPAVLLLIDEAQILFTHPEYGDRLRSLVEEYLRIGRGLGFGVIASVSTPTVHSFGGSFVLRDAFTAGPVLALRTAEHHGTDRLESRLGDRTPPSLLPSHWYDGSGTQGLGYLLDDDPETDPVLCRTLYTPTTASAGR